MQTNKHKNVIFDNSIIDDVLVVYKTNVETLLDIDFYGSENTFFTDGIMIKTIGGNK